VPILHVNGNDPEQVVHAIDIALRWRHKFGYDVVVDIVCYRKYGHNETDEPAFTHPIMYNRIKNSPSVATVYGEKLAKEGTFTHEEQEQFRTEYRASLEADVERSRRDPIEFVSDGFQSGEWAGFTKEYDHTPVETGVAEDTLRMIGERICAIPEDLHINPKLRKIVEARNAVYTEGKNIDWSSAEALAFGSLLTEKIAIRLSGEDSARGTFSQRHAVWWNVASSKPMPYTPLNNISPQQARFSVYDSPLSEFSVLGFEYGNSINQPRMLTLWEAQFGDFCNGAQVIIDNFIAAGESKWARGSGLVMLLPHGYEGQGAEHSSGHFERFLQLCAEDNIQVCDVTTPAQYFHLLRRQMKRGFRKPLVIMTPKSLLRHKRCVSDLSDFASGHFLEAVDDEPAYRDAEVVVMCTGKVYYDFIERRETNERKPAAIRIEQLYPFPEEQLRKVLSGYTRAKEWVWLQEEPRNRGAWTFMQENLPCVLGDRKVRYVGRAASASPATGSHKAHEEQIEQFFGEIFAPALTPSAHH
jgi:2-oxoglutarate dehydrogenase E1 component